MNTAIVIAGFVLVLLAIAWASRRAMGKQIDNARRQGFYPLPGQAPTMEHVHALAKAGHKIPAIKLYREIHKGTGLKEAKEAVEKLVH